MLPHSVSDYFISVSQFLVHLDRVTVHIVFRVFFVKVCAIITKSRQLDYIFLKQEGGFFTYTVIIVSKIN